MTTTGMNQIQPFAGTGQLTHSAPPTFTPSRSLTRHLSRINTAALVRAAQVDVETHLADIKVSAATGLATSAQQHVATLTAMEGELTKAVPLAANRMEMIGNLATIAVTEIVTDSISRLRRM